MRVLKIMIIVITLSSIYSCNDVSNKIDEATQVKIDKFEAEVKSNEYKEITKKLDSIPIDYEEEVSGLSSTKIGSNNVIIKVYRLYAPKKNAKTTNKYIESNSIYYFDTNEEHPIIISKEINLMQSEYKIESTLKSKSIYNAN